MGKDHFNVSAELLQKNAMKSTIRDLNAEFQMKGGKVSYKTSKKGDNYRLSHPDPEYLEQFKVRLFVELGLMDKKDIPEKKKEEGSQKPRYGEEHKLRRGWNVRSPKEFKEGRFSRGDRRRPEGSPWEKWKESRGRDERKTGLDRDRKGTFDMKSRREVPSSDMFRKTPRRDDLEKEFSSDKEEEKAKSFEERWGDISEYMEIIENALKDGAVDDGEIIKYAYDHDVDEEKIKTLKKLLWDNRCRGQRKNCPHGKKKFRFEDLMKVTSGEVDGYKKIDSPFTRFTDLWKKNMDRMYGDLADKNVKVRGKISSYKPVMRKDHEHLKILVFDTMVKPEGSDSEKETRKLWVKIPLEDFEKLTSGETIRKDDIISFKGKCIYDNYFHDYWVIDLKELNVEIPSTEGEPISF